MCSDYIVLSFILWQVENMVDYIIGPSIYISYMYILFDMISWGSHLSHPLILRH